MGKNPNKNSTGFLNFVNSIITDKVKLKNKDDKSLIVKEIKEENNHDIGGDLALI